MSLIRINTILICNTICCSDSIICYSACNSWWAHCTLSFYSIAIYYWYNFIL